VNNAEIQKAIYFYALCSKLKDEIRKGPKTWNVNRKRIESVAEHIYGTQMLAIAIYYQLGYKLDLRKILFMLAIHELDEIIMGDLAFFEKGKEEELIEEKEAVASVLKDFAGKEELIGLIDEFNERKTDEARFAYHCDKLDCDIQMKLYDQEGCFDLNNQGNNPAYKLPSVRKAIDNEKSLSNAWIEFDRSKYLDDPIFIDIIDWLKENNIK